MFHSFRRKGGATSFRPVRSRRARLLVQPLEGRVVPATFTVLNANDGGPGSLRQAILEAGAPGADDIAFDPAFFNAANPRTITLNSTMGQLFIGGDLTINGPGASILTVSGGGDVRVFKVPSTSGSSSNVTLKGMTVTDGDATIDGIGGGGILVEARSNLTLDGVVVTGNSTSRGGGGIAVTNFGGTVTLRNSTISGNTAGLGGGAIYFSYRGSLLVENSTISGNVGGTTFGDGGGIYFSGPATANGFTIRNSTIAGNTTSGSGGGLALRIFQGTALIQNSTITGNTANTTNPAAGRGGGGIAVRSNSDSTLTIESTIVSGNTASAANGRSDIAVDAATTAVNVNFSSVGDADGFTPSVSSGNNLAPGAVLNLQPLGDNGGPTQTVALGPGSAAVNAGSNPAGLTTDQRGPGFTRVQAGRIDIGAVESAADQSHVTAAAFPVVGTPGGTSYTFTVVYDGNTLIDVATVDGSDVVVTGPNGFSQMATLVSVTPAGNGAPRTATYAFTPPGGTFTADDDGPYTATLRPNQVANTAGGFLPPTILGTALVAIPQTFTVTNLNDLGPGSLRQAILNANATVGAADTIVFQAGLTGTILLTQASGQLPITDSVTIAGPGAANLTVSGGGVVRVFDVNKFNVVIDVTISGLTITGGAGITGGTGSTAPSFGGGITNRENLTLDGVVLTGNATGGTSVGGGGLFNFPAAPLTVRNSTVANNTATGDGGGIHLASGGIYFTGVGRLLVENSTISGNTAGGTQGGGGLYFWGPVAAGGFTIRNSTIANNRTTDTATAGGGGILLRSFNGTALIQNSTITGNSAKAATTTPGIGAGGVGIINGPITFGIVPVLTLVSTIVSGNTAVNGRDDISTVAVATVNANFSAIGDADGFTLSATSGNNLPFGAALGLDTLANNGGPTQTIAFAADSPLRNAGSNPANLTTDQRVGGFVRVEGPQADIGAFEFQNTAPRVLTATPNADQVNAAQRSRVTTLTVTFSTQVTFAGNVADAFAVSRIGGGTVGGFTATAAVVNGVTVVTLSGFTGAETEFGSLADGRYRLTVRANQIVGGFDGNGDGTPGDDYTLAGTVANGLYRLYGDANADGVINAADFALFRNAFGSAVGQAEYLAFLDFDNDGFINSFDFTRFRNRFGSGVP